MGETKATKLRCKPGDLVKVVASTNAELIGAFAVVDGLRSDGRWNVYLDRAARGLTIKSGLPVITREFCFRDESLYPIASVCDIVQSQPSRLRDDHHPHHGVSADEKANR